MLQIHICSNLDFTLHRRGAREESVPGETACAIRCETATGGMAGFIFHRSPIRHFSSGIPAAAMPWDI